MKSSRKATKCYGCSILRHSRKWKKSLDILPKRASMSESHYVPASKKVKCRQTIEKGSTTGGLRPYVTVKFRIICRLNTWLALIVSEKRWSHTSRVLFSGIPFVTWNLCKNSHQVPEMILKGRERILWVEFPKSAIVTKPKIVPYEMNSWFESLLLARYIRKFLTSFTYNINLLLTSTVQCATLESLLTPRHIDWLSQVSCGVVGGCSPKDLGALITNRDFFYFLFLRCTFFLSALLSARPR